VVYINWVYDSLSGITFSTSTEEIYKFGNARFKGTNISSDGASFLFDLENGMELEVQPTSDTAPEFIDGIRHLAELAMFPTQSVTSFSFELDQSLDSEDKNQTDDAMEKNDELDKFLDSFVVIDDSVLKST
jgi:hypothetical protein